MEGNSPNYTQEHKLIDLLWELDLEPAHFPISEGPWASYLASLGLNFLVVKIIYNNPKTHKES